jgi:hypothetical protein
MPGEAIVQTSLQKAIVIKHNTASINAPNEATASYQ